MMKIFKVADGKYNIGTEKYINIYLIREYCEGRDVVVVV